MPAPPYASKGDHEVFTGLKEANEYVLLCIIRELVQCLRAEMENMV